MPRIDALVIFIPITLGISSPARIDLRHGPTTDVLVVSVTSSCILYLLTVLFKTLVLVLAVRVIPITFYVTPTAAT